MARMGPVSLSDGVAVLQASVELECGGGRFLAPAEQVAHFVGIVGRDGVDYVRDVSVPVDVAMQYARRQRMYGRQRMYDREDRISAERDADYYGTFGSKS